MPKRLLIFSFLFIILTFSFKVYAASWSYQWQNTIVRINVGESINDYKNIPKAFLYKDGVLIEDAVINYSSDLYLGLSIDLVDTNRVGEYEVWYRAFENTKYSPGTCTGYRCKIKFIIEDKIPPDIMVLSPIAYIKRGDVDFDLASTCHITDNYAKYIVTATHSINFFKVGEYPVEIKAIDDYHNQSSVNIKAIIYEDEPPQITCLMPNNYLEVEYKSSINLANYFKANDRIDGDISSKIIYPSIDTSYIGSKSYSAMVRNSAGVEAVCSFVINVIDKEAPVIVLTKESLILDYLIDINAIDFSCYIKEIIDNERVDYNRVQIRHNIEQRVGRYNVWFSYNDGIYTANAELIITLVSYIKPKIINNEIRISLGELPDWKSKILIEDSSDPLIYESLIVDDSKVDYKVAGVYFVDASVLNSSGLSNSAKLKLIIDEKIATDKPGVTDDIIINGNIDEPLLGYEIDWLTTILFVLLVISVGVIIFLIIKKKRY